METFNPLFSPIPYLQESDYNQIVKPAYPDLNFESELGRNAYPGGELKRKKLRPFCEHSESRWKNAIDRNSYNITTNVNALNDWIDRPLTTIHKYSGNGENTGLVLFRNLWGGISTLGVTKKIFFKTTLYEIDGFLTDRLNKYSSVNDSSPFVFAVRPILVGSRRTEQIHNVLKQVDNNPVIEIPLQQKKRIAFLSLLYKLPWN